MKKSNKKYNFIIEAKNTIMEYGFNISFMWEDLQELVAASNGTQRKYIKHVLRCGCFDDNGWFYMPSTRKCLDTKH